MDKTAAKQLTDKIIQRLDKEVVNSTEYPEQVQMMIQALVLLGTPSKTAELSVLAVYRKGVIDTINIFADEFGKVAGA